MNAYDGCHVTIQVPVDFGNEKEKELRQTFDQELPGVWITVHGRESVTKPRISELSIVAVSRPDRSDDRLPKCGAIGLKRASHSGSAQGVEWEG
jgi:hypothetical protein